MTLASGSLDFIVIGAMKAGTTSLWQGIESHPTVKTPPDKERGFFNSEERYQAGFERYLYTSFPDASADQLLGTVTPGYMGGRHSSVVARMKAIIPGVKLIALLRDPIERAISAFRQGLRVGDVLAPTFEGHLADRRSRTSRVALLEDGHYGRILARYLEEFPRERLLVLYTQDLDERPATLYTRLFDFLEVEPHTPESARLNVGGVSSRVTPQALDELESWLVENVWPKVDLATRRGFNWWLRYHWNIDPDKQLTTIEPDTRDRLRERYLEDAEVLRDITGELPPWVAAWTA